MPDERLDRPAVGPYLMLRARSPSAPSPKDGRSLISSCPDGPPGGRSLPFPWVGRDRRARRSDFQLLFLYISFLHINYLLMQPVRKKLPHGIPYWVGDDAYYFVTICTRPRGIDQLCHAKTWKLLRESLLFRQNKGALWIHLLLLMPDHLHGIMSFAPEVGMAKTIADWKRYTCIHGDIRWQADFFDHRLRNTESYVEKAHYIRMNPVRAGLIDTPEQWPYIWENRV